LLGSGDIHRLGLGRQCCTGNNRAQNYPDKTNFAAQHEYLLFILES
jgi:hypothetical protein